MDVLRDLAKWLTPVSVSLDSEVLGRRRAATVSVSAHASDPGLVEAAFGVITEATRATVEDALQEADDVFVRGGSDELVSMISAVGILHALQNPQVALTPALFTLSARFLGLKPKIGELIPNAQAVTDKSARESRERRTVRPAERLKRLATNVELELTDVRDAANAISRRLDDSLETIQSRLESLDEEVDVLWWARANRSDSTNEIWTEISDIRRAVIAPVELTRLVSVWPPTSGISSLMRDRIGDLEGTATVEEVGRTLAELIESETARPGPLRPLRLAAFHWREVGDNREAARALMERDGVDPDTVIDIATVPDQVLREIQLR